MSKTLNRSVLAVAIAMASAHAVAQEAPESPVVEPVNHVITLDAESLPVSLVDEAYDTLTIEGAFAGTDDAVSMEALQLTGDLANNADITLDATGVAPFASAIDLSENDLGDRATIGGSFTNNGAISVTGDDATAVVLEAADFGGSILNTGSISAASAAVVDGARALEINSVSVEGDIANSGSISLVADESIALNVEGSTVAGALSNSGTISAEGFNAAALHIADTEIVGGLSNSGTISATGQDVSALDLDLNAVVGSVSNTGSITAVGQGALAVLVDGATLDTINNNGNIAGESVGIAVDQVYLPLDGEATGVTINHNGGLISGGDYAIFGSSAQETYLNWSAGDVAGRIANLTHINVNGDVNFDGAAINVAEYILVSKDSVLNLVQNTTEITGDFRVAADGAVGMALSTDVAVDQPVLSIQGIAEFEDGSQILVAANTADFLGEGRDFILVKATALTADNVDLVSQSLALSLTRLESANGDSIDVHVQTKDRDAMMAEIAAAGGNGSAQAAGAEFVQLMSGLVAEHSEDAVFQAMMTASTAGQLAKLAKELAPEMSGAATHAAQASNAMSSNAIANRSTTLRSGMSSGVDLSKTGVWVRGMKSDAEQDMRDGIEGYSADATGFVLGADAALSDELTAGVYFGQTKTDVKSDAGNKVDADNNLVGVYTTWNRDGLFVDTNLSYGEGDNDSKRFVAGTTAEGSYDSKMLALSVTAGNTYNVEGLTVEPRVSARYSNLEIDGYTETGSLAALSLGKQRVEVGEIGAGLRVAGQVDFAGGILEPEASFMAYHDLIADSADTTAAFVVGGNSFVSSGASVAKNSYEAGLGATYRRGNMSFNVSYDRLTKSDFSADVVGAKFRYDF